MKPVVVLALFLFCVISNVALVDAHSIDNDHGGNDSAHIHLPDHQHDLKAAVTDFEEQNHSEDHDEHIHLCFHFIPLTSNLTISDRSSSPGYKFQAFDYLGLFYTPPVPPPTA